MNLFKDSFSGEEMIDHIKVYDLIDEVEAKMQSDLFISAGFEQIRSGKLSTGRRILIIIINFMTSLTVIRSLIAIIADPNSPWQYYCFNPLLAYGFLGRFMSAVFICGHGNMFVHALVLYWKEGQGKLTPIIDIRDMYRNLSNPTKEEVNKFTYFLKIMPYINLLGLAFITGPLGMFRALGAVLTAYNYHGFMFLSYYFPVMATFLVVNQYCCNIYIYVHILIAQSTTYFRIRLTRVEKDLQKACFESKKGIDYSKQHDFSLAQHINRALLDLQDTLDQVAQHNELLKHLLRDGLVGMGGVFVNFLVFMLGPNPWYFRIIPVGTVVFVGIVTGCSFGNASELYVRILNMAKVLHSCQSVVQNDLVSRTNKRASVGDIYTSILDPKKCMSFEEKAENLKCKFQILRMIHRVSSRYLRIGYTVGNGDSFSPSDSASFVSNILGTSLMFLNTKHAFIS